MRNMHIFFTPDADTKVEMLCYEPEGTGSD